MSSAPRSKLQVQCSTESNRSDSEVGLLACPRCEKNEWVLDSDRLMRCLSCGGTLPIENNIIDCLSMGGTLGPTATDWDAFYQGSLKPYSEEADWWTLACWRKYLFESIIRALSGELIVDFGCGNAARVAALAPIQAHAYRYVGVDSSMEALKRAAQFLPGAFFVHADLSAMKLKCERADVALCLGILMYFKEFREPLGKLLNALKPGGILLLHEQIRRKSWTQTVRAFFALPHETYPASFGIQSKELRQCLVEQGSIIRAHFAGSPLRRVAQKLFDGTPLERFRPFAAWVDWFWCATVGRAFPSVGASEIQVVFRKRDKPSSVAAASV